MTINRKIELESDISTTESSNLAVLFDADNTSQESVKAILDACARYGRVIIKRSYGDWTSPNLRGWALAFKEFAIKPIQQFRCTVGKNVTDSAMIIDAMDILHSKDVDLFVLVSSDSDFTGLATRIREEGLKVIGVGRRVTPITFANACDKFLLIENLTETEITKTTVKENSNNTTKEQFTKEVVKEIIELPKNESNHSEEQTLKLPTKEQGQDLLIRAVKTAQQENGLLTGSDISLALRRLDPAFDPKSYGVSKVGQFIKLYPGILELQSSRSGCDVIYKSKLV